MSSIQDHESGPETGPGISRRAAECAVALILIALSAAVLWDSYSRGAGWNDGPQTGFFPARVGWILLIASAFVFVNGYRRPPSIVVTWAQLRRVATVFIPLTVYVAAVGYLGLYVSSAIFIFGFMVALGRFSWWSAALTGVAISVMTFWVFEIQFQVPLPKGPLEAMLGY